MLGDDAVICLVRYRFDLPPQRLFFVLKQKKSPRRTVSYCFTGFPGGPGVRSQKVGGSWKKLGEVRESSRKLGKLGEVRESMKATSSNFP